MVRHYKRRHHRGGALTIIRGGAAKKNRALRTFIKLAKHLRGHGRF